MTTNSADEARAPVIQADREAWLIDLLHYAIQFYIWADATKEDVAKLIDSLSDSDEYDDKSAALVQIPRYASAGEAQQAVDAILASLPSIEGEWEARTHPVGDLFEPARIPVITLWQPWASLCFVEDAGLRKCMETRGYRPPLKHVGGIIAIHAAAAHPSASNVAATLADLASHAFGPDWRRTLPLGCILGTVTLSGGIPVEQVRDSLSAVELVAGDYGDGRFAWPLSDPHGLATPVPAKGKQGWWSIDAAMLSATPSSDGERGK